MKIVIPGEPEHEARMRMTRRGKHTTLYNPKNAYKSNTSRVLSNQWLESPKLQYPHLSFIFAFSAPKSLPKSTREELYSRHMKKLTKPDIDNCIKIYMDIMTGICFEGDQQCSIGFAYKIYSPYPRTIIWAEESLSTPQLHLLPDPFHRAVASELCGIPPCVETGYPHDSLYLEQ